MNLSIKYIRKKRNKENRKNENNENTYNKNKFKEQIRIEEKIVGDRQNGILEKYMNGKLLSKTPYCDGKIDGKVYTYFEDGNIESVQTYKKGFLHGISVIYDRKGNVIYDSEYENGDRVGHSNFDASSYMHYDGDERHI